MFIECWSLFDDEEFGSVPLDTSRRAAAGELENDEREFCALRRVAADPFLVSNVDWDVRRAACSLRGNE